MKRVNLLFFVIMLIGSSLFLLKTNSVAAKTQGINLLNNASFENSQNNLPIGWAKNKYGSNTSTFTYNSFGHTGNKSASVKMTNYKSGDAKWVPTTVTITPNTKYTFSNWYQSNTYSYIYAVYETTSNSTVYTYLAYANASATWKYQEYTFTTPTNAKSITIFHFIKSKGSLTIDDYNLSIAQVAPVPTPTNLILNSSVEQSINNLPTNWDNDSWKVNTGTNSYESTGYTGTHSLKTTISSYSAGDAYWYFDPVAVIPGKTYSFTNYYKSNADTEIDIMVNLSNGTTVYYYLGMAASSPNSWSRVNVEFTMPANSVSATVYQALAQVGYVQTDDYSFTEYQPQKLNRALVSINFDDNWLSVYQNALPILNKYGFTTTQYVITDTFDHSNHMNIAMMQSLKNQGNEIASHSVSHLHLTTLSAAELTNELLNSQVKLHQSFGTNGVANNFASPYGEYNTSIINEIKKYYRSHRSTDVGFNSKDSFNVYNIKVQNIISTTTASEVQTWVNEAMATNTWLVLVYHEINTTYDGTKFTTTSSDFDAQMNVIKQSGITIKTNNQALDEIIPQL